MSVNRVQTLGGSNDVQPTQTDAQVTYDLGKGGRAFLRERWSAAPVQSFAAATQALTTATGGTHATELGFARRVGNATVDTSYLIDHGANGSDVFATMGVRERISLGRTKGDAFYQHATAAGTHERRRLRPVRRVAVVRRPREQVPRQRLDAAAHRQRFGRLDLARRGRRAGPGLLAVRQRERCARARQQSIRRARRARVAAVAQRQRRDAAGVRPPRRHRAR